MTSGDGAVAQQSAMRLLSLVLDDPGVDPRYAAASLAALMLLIVFVRESGHSVAETVLVGREEIGGYVRHARGLVPGAAGE